MLIIIISGKTPKSILKKSVKKWYHGLLSLNRQTPPTSSCCSLVITILLSTIRQTPDTQTQNGRLLFFSHALSLTLHKLCTSLKWTPSIDPLLFFSIFLWVSIQLLLNRFHLKGHITRNSWSTNSEVKMKLHINTKHKSRPKTNHYYSQSDS